MAAVDSLTNKPVLQECGQVFELGRNDTYYFRLQRSHGGPLNANDFLIHDAVMSVWSNITDSGADYLYPDGRK